VNAWTDTIRHRIALQLTLNLVEALFQPLDALCQAAYP
jgi:hypothetical protein